MSSALDHLSEIHRQRMELWMLCTRCGHTRHYRPSDLRGRLRRKIKEGDDTLLNVARHFRCSACGSRQIMLVPYAPEAGKSAA